MSQSSRLWNWQLMKQIVMLQQLRLTTFSKKENIHIETQTPLSSERIEPCLEAYNSQVHMAKPPGKDKYRFCIDFSNLNNATEPIY